MLESIGHDAEMATLAEIGRALLEAPLDEDAISELIYQLAGRIVQAESFQLGLLRDDRYHIKVWVKDGQRQAPDSFDLPEGHGIIRWIQAERRPQLVRDFRAEIDSLPARPTYISERPPRSAVFVPMLAGDRVIGALAIQSPRPNAFDESHLRVLSVLANQSAAVLSNASLYEHGQRRLNALMAVSEVGRKIASILDLDELLTQVVESIRARFGYYHVQVFLVKHGISEALSPASEVFGEERLLALMRETRSLSADEIAATVADAVQAFIGDETQPDDITLIVLKRNEDETSPESPDAD